ncbi:MAG: hypothetical protein RMJ07_06220 [Nitrososphaerota archaeon]|nr:hypothetical protein [Candidatus Bathyarchaeota archaeon]MDW8049255.1 hypothetical protein [Nitrososphaerota archaeon]
MKESNSSKIGKWDLIYALIGGGLGFAAVYTLYSIIFSPGGIGALYWSLSGLGILGVLSFQEEFRIASAILQFGLVHLIGSFCGGFYTGYKVQENLKFILIIPGVVIFSAFIILLFFEGAFANFTMTTVLDTILAPLCGNFLGSYLGGYAANWPTEEESD